MPTKTYVSIVNQYTSKFILVLCFISVFICNSCSTDSNINLADLGNKHFIEHKYDKALEIYEEALKKGYKSFDVLYNLGFIYYYERKELKKAEQIFKEGLLLYPDSDILHSTLSQLYFELDNFSEAVKEYKQAVILAKDRSISINANKAKNLLKLQGKSEEEINNFFNEIINVNSKDRLALYEVAEYEKNHGKCAEALAKYKRIVELDVNMKSVVLRDMGVCYYKLGEYKLALSHLEEAKKNGDYIPEGLLQEIKSRTINP